MVIEGVELFAGGRIGEVVIRKGWDLYDMGV
jgi:hypothetical protein